MNTQIIAKVGDAIKKIPWGEIKKHGPEIVAAGKVIYDNFMRKKEGISIEDRLKNIEETEKDQQAYIAELANVIIKNSDYMHRLSMRINVLFAIIIGILIYLILS